MWKKLKWTLFSVLVVGIGAYSQKNKIFDEVLNRQGDHYKVVASTSKTAKFTSIVVTEGGNKVYVVNFDKSAWNRDFSGEEPVHISFTGQAIQANDSSAEMIVKVLYDGVVIRNVVATGSNMNANVGF